MLQGILQVAFNILPTNLYFVNSSRAVETLSNLYRLVNANHKNKKILKALKRAHC